VDEIFFSLFSSPLQLTDTWQVKSCSWYNERFLYVFNIWLVLFLHLF